MAIIKLPLLYVGDKGNKRLNTLLDIDFNLSLIHPDCLDNLVSPFRLRRKRILPALNNMVVKEAIIVDFYINDVLLSDDFLVVPDLAEQVIIGSPTFRKWRMKIDYVNKKILVDPNVAKLRIPYYYMNP